MALQGHETLRANRGGRRFHRNCSKEGLLTSLLGRHYKIFMNPSTLCSLNSKQCAQRRMLTLKITF